MAAAGDELDALPPIPFLFMSEHGQAFNGNVLPSSAEHRNRLLRIFAEQLGSMGVD
jgi:hypothetical protein